MNARHVPDVAGRWLAEHDASDRGPGRLKTVPRNSRRVETRWDRNGTMIRVYLPRRNYRAAAMTVLVSPYEAEALIRNLSRRLAERGGAV